MKKGILIETVYLKLNGGQLTDESSIDRRDIRAYLPAAVNEAIAVAYGINLQVENDRDYSSLFYGFFAAQPVLIDNARHKWKYLTLPKGTMALPHNQGIRGIEDGCGDQYKPLSDNGFRTIKHYAPLLNGAKYYRLEGNKIYLFNAPPSINNISLSMIVDTNSLTDEDELPIQAGLETQVIENCYKYFSGERHETADRKNDKRDIN